MLENIISWLTENFSIEKALTLVVVGLALGGGLRVGKYCGEKGLTYTNSFLVALLGYLFIKYTNVTPKLSLLLFGAAVLIFIMRRKRSD